MTPTPEKTLGMQRFLRRMGYLIAADGIYGPETQSAQQDWSSGENKRDPKGWNRKHGKVAKKPLRLPRTFIATHPTGGLAGYPAVDVFAPAGAIALSPAAGTIRRVSGRAPTKTAKPGGPYGRSLYLRSGRGEYYLTHFGTLLVGRGESVKAGQPLGTVADYSGATKGVTPSHIHEGLKQS